MSHTIDKEQKSKSHEILTQYLKALTISVMNGNQEKIRLILQAKECPHNGLLQPIKKLTEVIENDNGPFKDIKNRKEIIDLLNQYTNPTQNIPLPAAPVKQVRVSILLPDGTTYNNLLEAEQDKNPQRLNLEELPEENGIFSRGFASCFAIIMKSDDNRRFSLEHVSSPSSDEAIYEEASFVSNGFKNNYSVELAICRSGYEECYDKEDPTSLKTEEFFTKSISEYTRIFRELLEKKPTVIHELPLSSNLLLDKSGVVHTFKEWGEDEIQVKRFTDSKAVKLSTFPQDGNLNRQTSSENYKPQLTMGQNNFMPPPLEKKNTSKKRKREKQIDKKETEEAIQKKAFRQQ